MKPVVHTDEMLEREIVMSEMLVSRVPLRCSICKRDLHDDYRGDKWNHCVFCEGEV